MTKYLNLEREESNKAEKEMNKWKKKAIFWHNSIPNFDYDIRSSLTKDVQTVTNIEQLELNKRLFLGINIHNWLTIIISVINLILLIVNLYLILK